MSNMEIHPYQGGDTGGGEQPKGKNNKYTKDEDLQPEVDKELENGPLYNRHCTDVICCPLFVIFIVGMAWAFIYGLSEGDPNKLVTLFDYDGNGCGYHSQTKDFDFIYWPDLSYSISPSEVLRKTLCVKYCPKSTSTLTSDFCYPNSLFSSCTALTPYDTNKYVNKFCLPDTSSGSSSAKAAYDAIMEDYGGEYITTYMADVYYCWWVCIIAAFLAFFISFVYMFLLKW